jgi:biotin carboxylase
MSVEAAMNFRDKARMKNVLRSAGLPCARHALVERSEDAWQFAEQVGYPIVAKPPAGAGSLDTFQAENADSLRGALRKMAPAPGRAALLEEFVTGDEHSMETISIGGRQVFHSLTHYIPSPLHVMRNPWIQWAVVLPREADEPQYDDAKRIGDAALQALGMRTGLSHMEWFRRKDGTVAISEIAARPPGAQITTLVSRAHDMDFVREWARVMVFDQFEAPPRKYAVGSAFLRGQGQGRVKAIHGLEEAAQAVGALVTDVKLPEIGQGPGANYEGEGFVIVRHPETRVVVQAVQRLVSLIRVEMS